MNGRAQAHPGALPLGHDDEAAGRYPRLAFVRTAGPAPALPGSPFAVPALDKRKAPPIAPTGGPGSSSARRDNGGVNDRFPLAGIPAEAHGYEVNGRTPLEWLIDRYRIARGRESGIVDDPNAWFEDPRDLIAAIRRVVHLSVETVRIVEGLPEPFGDE